MGRTSVSWGVPECGASKHFGDTPETGVLLKIVSGE
jgi:hypothetical protein